LLDRKFSGYNYGISIGRMLDNSIVENIAEGLTIEYYFHYCKINEELAFLSGRIAADLNAHNLETINIPLTVSTEELDTIYFNTLRSDLSHKLVATRAGQGAMGRIRQNTAVDGSKGLRNLCGSMPDRTKHNELII
jgi:hypothetical protein